MERRIGITKIKANFEELVDEVASGAEIVITRYGKPVAKIMPMQEGGPEKTPAKTAPR